MSRSRFVTNFLPGELSVQVHQIFLKLWGTYCTSGYQVRYATALCNKKTKSDRQAKTTLAKLAQFCGPARPRHLLGGAFMSARVEELKRGANAAVSRLEFSLALAHLDEAIALSPSAALLFSNRAYVHEMLQQPERALSDAERSVQLAPEYAKGHLRRGRALIALGRFDDASERLQLASQRRRPFLRCTTS